MYNIPDQDIQQIIANPERADLIVKHANKLGESLASSLNTTQIRALFSEVRQIESQMSIDHQKAWRRLYLLKPKMAYRAKRAQSNGVYELVKVLDPAVVEVLKAKGEMQQKLYYKHFVEFFEAILAYHKYHGGR